MKQIVILSDTHGLLRDAVLEECSGAEAILHAGDVDNIHTWERLRSFGNLHVVRGNNDYGWGGHLPKSLTVELEGLRFFLVHDKMDVPKDLTGIDVVVYGHSHQYRAEVIDGVLWLNPGSCGKRRFDLDITLCRMAIEDGQYQLEKVRIPTGS